MDFRQKYLDQRNVSYLMLTGDASFMNLVWQKKNYEIKREHVEWVKLFLIENERLPTKEEYDTGCEADIGCEGYIHFSFSTTFLNELNEIK